MGMTTEEFAKRAGLKPATIRHRVCMTGSYFGILPEKFPNRRLSWPEDAHVQLLKNRGQLIVIERTAQQARIQRRQEHEQSRIGAARA